MNMKIENHEIHEYENDNIMKTIKYTQEIHETMNLKTRMLKICELYEMYEYEFDIFPWNPKQNMKQSNAIVDPA